MDPDPNTSSGQPLRRRFSLSSIFSLKSIQTNLPEYSERTLHDGVDEGIGDNIHPPEFDANTNFSSSRQSPSAGSHLAPSRRPFNILGKQVNFSFTFSPPSDVECRSFGQLSTIHKALRGGGSTVAGTSLPLRGQLILELPKAQVIQSISLTIVGAMFHGPVGDRWKFLNQVVQLWKKGSMTPLPIQVESDDLAARPHSVYMPTNGKLSAGTYRIHFSQPLLGKDDSEAAPEVTDSPSGRPGDITPFVLDKKPTLTRKTLVPNAAHYPPSWQEKGADVTISYKMVAEISFGRLHTSKSMELPFVYMNALQADRMSKPRREAYEKKSRLLPPSEDPLCWIALPVVRLTGTLGESEVSLQYTFFVAGPCSYTVGSVTPCYVEIRSNNQQNLEAFADPKAIFVRLRRNIQYFDSSQPRADSASALMSFNGTPSIESILGASHGEGSSRKSVTEKIVNGTKGIMKEIDTECNVGVWWLDPVPETKPGQPTMAAIQGEIHLPRDLLPTCTTELFRVQYYVDFMAPLVTSFKRTGPTIPVKELGQGRLETPLLRQLVTIATSLAPGDPDPIPQTKPIRIRRRIHQTTELQV